MRIRFAPFGKWRSFGGVSRLAYPRTIVEFQERFATEEAWYLLGSHAGHLGLGALHERTTYNQIGRPTAV